MGELAKPVTVNLTDQIRQAFGEMAKAQILAGDLRRHLDQLVGAGKAFLREPFSPAAQRDFRKALDKAAAT